MGDPDVEADIKRQLGLSCRNYELLSFLPASRTHRGPCGKAIRGYLHDHPKHVFDDKLWITTEIIIVGMGAMVENITQLVVEANEQLSNSKKELQSLHNDLKAMLELTAPLLGTYIKEVRSFRMTTVSEIQQMMNMLGDVRTFFLESAYETEMQRLERFVKLCRELKALKEDGSLDAICNSAIRLGLKEEV